jgi:tetratricopeptide (TPR) repeat protein
LLNPEIKPDLENILLKALHLEPSRRYRSARDLAEDLQAFLENRPVKASPDSVVYRLRRFVERNKIITAALAFALVAILTGTAVSLYEAHRAEQRFAQVRELAAQFIFDFEASIRQTPGTLAARRKMASTASRYLASLEADSGHDPDLQRELAESYYRLSVVNAEAQQYDAWLRDLKRSAAILQSLGDDLHGPDKQRALYINVLNDLVGYWIDRTPANAPPFAAEAVRDALAFHNERPNSVFSARALVTAHTMQGTASANINRVKDAIAGFSQAVHSADSLLTQFPNDDELLVLRVEASNRWANLLTQAGDGQQAFSVRQATIALFDPFIARHPENSGWRLLRIRLATGYDSTLRRLAATNPSLEKQVTPAFRDTYLMAKNNADRNPGNHVALDLAYVMASRYASQLARVGDLSGELAVRQQATSFLDILAKAEPNDHRTLTLTAQNLGYQSDVMLKLHQWQQAETTLVAALAAVDKVLAQWPDDRYALDERVPVLLELATIDEHFSRLSQARQHCDQAMQTATLMFQVIKEAKDPVSNIEDLRLAARRLGVADTTPH